MISMQTQQLAGANGRAECTEAGDSLEKQLLVCFQRHMAKASASGQQQTFDWQGLSFTLNQDAVWEEFRNEFRLVNANRKVKSHADYADFSIEVAWHKLADAA